MRPTRNDFKALADARLAEAKALHAAGHSMGAYYLAGYSVECALKACICGAIKPNVWPDRGFSERIYTHDLAALMGASGMKPKLQRAMRTNPALAGNWGHLSKWSEQDRYERRIDANDSSFLIDAIENPSNGILTWIKRQTQW